jgi:cytoskeletal protein CcmA (bactofilin family)
MFRRVISPAVQDTAPIDRITSVLGPGVIWKGDLRGSGGIRIEGNFEGDIVLRGMLVVGETGKVTCDNLNANTVIVAGMVKGNIKAEKLEIRSTGRVWGDVHVVAFSTEEGSFLRGHVTMEDRIELSLDNPINEPTPVEGNPETIAPQSSEPVETTLPVEEPQPEPVKVKPVKAKKR